ncbi:hypothetical protein EBR43_07055 [bacterium]|nr:hypothetical protein [bacterium]
MNLESSNYFVMPMFIVPYLKLEVSDWENKKKKLLELMNKCDLDIDSFLSTSFSDKDTTSQNASIESILAEEFNCMKKSFNFDDCSIKQSWFQEQTKNMFHPLHHHCGNNIMMSSICYIDYDPSVHTATRFISPYIDSISCSYINFTPEVTEGTIIFFPSNILHHTLPSDSDKSRKIVSFNLEAK